MTEFFSTLNARLQKHSSYRRTLRELRGLPMETRIDLDMAGIEKDVARRAVYG
ncbi:glyceraldehyde-3-phosphate dehydrogenase [Roseivivax halodurans JCM 10272]|uniref:Glyceraldehyde-3-phosphate dehydrogenase n=1 Tax=Roseivivax halodurans JCM 10272 TaxID=1449350 RepID=X7EK68_9RHOB|nr:glyceraldehyde-3-phosphate dehydrogenase [Roseivivax halodurans]ETX16479.1 glyceraldehyde-3-phosphate dehydrogenase [Roseivivax halodurans JCM 10272]